MKHFYPVVVRRADLPTHGHKFMTVLSDQYYSLVHRLKLSLLGERAGRMPALLLANQLQSGDLPPVAVALLTGKQR